MVIAVFFDSVYIANLLLHVSGDGIMFIFPVLSIALILIISGVIERVRV